MRFRMEVRGPAPGESSYLLVQAPAGTTWATLDVLVRRRLGLSDDTVLRPVDECGLEPGVTVGTAPLLDGLAVVVVPAPTGRGPTGTQPSGPAVARLVVTGGPDAGGAFLLRTGEHLLGRSRYADVCVDDPALSRRHALICVRPDGIRVQDLGSANGTRVDGVDVGAGWTSLDVGSTLDAGGSSLRLGPCAPGLVAAARSAAVTTDGMVIVSVPARVAAAPTAPSAAVSAQDSFPGPVRPCPAPGANLPALPSGQVISYPSAPALQPDNRAVVVAALAPMVMALGLALALRSWPYLLIALLGPLTLLGQHIVDRRSRRCGQARRTDEYAAARADADRAVADALERERSERYRMHPPLDRVLAVAAGHIPGLWQGVPGRPQWSIRLGCGVRKSRVAAECQGRSRLLELTNAPLTLELDGRAVAICGSRRDVAGLARSVLIQLATLHDPDRCRLRLGTSVAGFLGGHWLDWMPHLGDEIHAADGRRDLVVLMAPATGLEFGRPPVSRAVLVLVDGLAPEATIPPWCDITVRVTAEGLAVLTAEDPAGEPAPGPRRTAFNVGPVPAHGPTTRTAIGRGGQGGRAELLSRRHADAAARALAPLRPSRAGGTGPAVTRGLLEALGLPDDVPGLTRRLRQRWSMVDAGGCARVRLGDVIGGQHRRDGADDSGEADGSGEAGGAEWHCRPAGCERPTGSGGREGSDGSDAAPCEFDLDRDGPHLLLAGMTGSGKSELLQTLITGLVLTHPPQELALVLMDYKGGSAFAPFAALPHTVGLLTDLDPESTARALRALGAELRHREALFRAAGVADARGYRAYRHKRPDADPLPRLVVVVDEYRVLAEDHSSLMSALVRIAGLGRGLGLHLVLATQRPGGVVSAEIRANVNARIALRVRDIAESLDVLDVADAARLDPHLPGRGYLRVGSRAPVAFAAVRVGEPVRTGRAEQLEVTRRSSPGPAPDRSKGVESCTDGEAGVRGPAIVDVVVAAAIAAARRDGHHRPPPIWAPPLPDRVGVTPPDPDGVSTATTGRCGQAAFAAGAQHQGAHPPTLIWRYGLADDRDGRRVNPLSWRPLEDGHLALVGTGRSGRTAGVLALLAALSTSCPNHVHVAVIDAAGGLSSAAELPHCAEVAALDDLGGVRRLLERLTSAAPASGRPPLTVLVIHGWELLCGALDALDHGRAVAMLTDLLRGGAASGVRVLLTGDRALLAGAVTGLVEQKVVLRLADARDALLAGVRQPAAVVPGRGVHLPSGAAVQLAAARPHDLRHAGTSARSAHPRCRPAPRHPTLPRRLRLQDVPSDDRPDRLIIGLDAEGGPAWVDPGGSLLITGPAGSGRTSALRAIAQRATAHGRRVLHIGPDDDVPSHVPASDTGQTHAVALVDDLDELPAQLVQRLEQLVCGGMPLVATMRTTNALHAYTGVVGRLRRGDALILSPTPSDGQLVGVTLGAGEAAIPGRAALVRRGRVHVVQVAAADETGPEPDPLEPSSTRTQ